VAAEFAKCKDGSGTPAVLIYVLLEARLLLFHYGLVKTSAVGQVGIDAGNGDLVTAAPSAQTQLLPARVVPSETSLYLF